MIKVSVVVPVYNGEKYLRECLDSICNQTLREIEILCVDDGSTDASMGILEEYRDSDDRFRIFAQEHQYAGSARNLGMSHAKGEYLVFWDCDDYFDPQALEKLYERAKQTDADVVVCGANQYYENKHRAYPSDAYLKMKLCPDTETFNRFSNPQYYLNFTNVAAWNKLYKRSYIEKMGLQFQPVRNGNDIYFAESALGLADRIALLNEKLITYRRNRENGLVSTSSAAPLTPIQAWIDVAKNLEGHDGFGEQSFANMAIDAMVYLLYNLQDWEAFRKAVEALQSYGLKAMHIFPEKDYYYNEWREKCADHLHHDTPEQIAVFFMYHFYIQRDEANADRRLLNLQLKDLKKANQEQKKEIQALKKENSTLKKENRSLNKGNEKLEKKNEKLRKEGKNIRNSTIFRVGSVITWLPRKIKTALK